METRRLKTSSNLRQSHCPEWNIPAVMGCLFPLQVWQSWYMESSNKDSETSTWGRLGIQRGTKSFHGYWTQTTKFVRRTHNTHYLPPHKNILFSSIFWFKCTWVYKVWTKEKVRREAHPAILYKSCVYTPCLLGLVLRKSFLTVSLCHTLGWSTSFWPLGD